MEKGLIIIGVVCLVLTTVDCDLTCISCTGIEDTSECQHNTTCSSGEVCFVQKHITESGSKLYDMGCAYSQYCRRHVGPSFGRRSSEGHHIVCETCCDYSDECNKDLQCSGQVHINPIDECSDITSETTDGVYILSPAGLEVKVEAFCDLHTDGHKWTVIQRRFNGSLDFYKNWTSYEHGFGSPYGEYYIGNKVIHAITSQGRHVLRVIMTDFAGVQKYAEYSSFRIGDSSSQYQLSCAGYSGNAGDSLASRHGGYKFYTYDKDDSYGCAKVYHGAWWYNTCHASNLNGKYYHGGSSPYGIGMNWYSFHGYHYSMKSTVMMIRRA